MAMKAARSVVEPGLLRLSAIAQFSAAELVIAYIQLLIAFSLGVCAPRHKIIAMQYLNGKLLGHLSGALHDRSITCRRCNKPIVAPTVRLAIGADRGWLSGQRHVDSPSRIRNRPARWDGSLGLLTRRR